MSWFRQRAGSVQSRVLTALVVCAGSWAFGAAHFRDPVGDGAAPATEQWSANHACCTYEAAYDGKRALAIDSTPTPGNNWYYWSTRIDEVAPNTDYRISFDRMHDTLGGKTTGVARCYLFGHEIPVPNSDQPRIWDRFAVTLNSAQNSGTVEFRILHYNDDKKTWFRDFRIEEVRAKPLEPVAGAAVNCTNPALVWDGLPDSSFLVQLSQDSTFPPALTRTLGPILAQTTVRVDPPLAAGTWHWRIAAAAAALIVPEQARYGAPESFVVAADVKPAVLPERPPGTAPVAAVTTVSSDPTGRLLVDGKPVFLIGLYAVMEKRAELVEGSYMTPGNVASCEPLFAELAQAGFNTIQNYGTAAGRMAETAAYLDLADRHNLWVLMELQGVEGMEKDLVERQMRTYAAHPSVLAWLLVDEGDMKGWSPVKARMMRDHLRAVDPFRPAGMVVRDCASYANAVDLLLPDPYTLRSGFVPQHDLHQMLAGCTQAARQAQSPIPVVAILQAFKYEDEFDKANRERGRVPSFDEERCISYLAIANDHQGVLFYAYHSSATYLKEYPEHWAEMKRLAGELRARTPIFLGAKVAVPAAIEGDGLVSFAREHEGAVYVFVVNPGVAPVAMNCALKMGDAVVTCVETGLPVAVAAGARFGASLRPFEVQTYRIARGQQPAGAR
jgi:hypothetical protein